MIIDSTSSLKDAFAERAKHMQLEVECCNGGSFLSDIAIVGEAPGDHEVRKGMPMVGASGSLLWKLARKYNIDRRRVYVTNVSKRQVSTSKSDSRVPMNKHEQQLWHDLLQWELAQLPNLKYILVMGNMALQAITGNSKIGNWRGSVLDVTVGEGNQKRPAKVLCTYNAAAIIKEPKLELTFKFDLGKFNKVVNENWHHTPVTTHINPTYMEARSYLDHLIGERKPTAYDIESIGNETACIGFANDPNEAMCINFRGINDNAYEPIYERQLRKRIAKVLSTKSIPLVAQNNMFDSTWLSFKDRISVQPIWFDTMLAHHCLYPQLPHNLGYITTQYTTRPYYKDELSAWKEGGDIDSFWHYNGQDCCNTLVSAIGMHAELKSQRLDKFFFNHIMRAQPYLAQMSVGGIRIDMDLKRKLNDTIGSEVDRLLGEFYSAVFDIVGDSEYAPNPRSPKQLSDLLFRKLKLVGRGSKTDAENRKRMYSHPSTTEPKRKVLRAIDELAKEQKFYSTYVKSGIDDDGRARCTYNQIGVQSAPGRLSSSGMLWRNSEGIQTGSNHQNQPTRAYPMYIADPGYALGYFDLSQAEARYVGWDAEIELWMEQFERARLDGSYDCHVALASEMFDIPYDDVPTFDRYESAKGHVIPEGKFDGDITLRFIAKRCRHGLNYRMGPDRLSAVTGLSLSAAHDAYRTYHRITPELQRWWASIEAEVRSDGHLFNAYGRRLIILERLTPEALESIVAFKPQSTIGDKVTRVIYKAQEDDRWPIHARMMLNIHDALICTAPESKVKTCLSIMKKYAEEPIMVKGRELIIPADTKLSYKDDRGYHSWGGLADCDIQAAA